MPTISQVRRVGTCAHDCYLSSTHQFVGRTFVPTIAVLRAHNTCTTQHQLIVLDIIDCAERDV